MNIKKFLIAGIVSVFTIGILATFPFEFTHATSCDRWWNPSGNANWLDANVWALTEGGTANASTPTSSQSVCFSNANNYNVTLTDHNAVALDLDFNQGTGYTGTITGDYNLSVYGNIILASTGTYSFQKLSMSKSSGTATMTSNANANIKLAQISFASGGTFQLQDDWKLNAPVGYTTVMLSGTGTFDANSNGIEFYRVGKAVILNAMTFYDLTVTGGTNTIQNFFINADITVSNSLTIAGNSVARKVAVRTGDFSSFTAPTYTFHTPHTITSASNTISNAVFIDIAGAGVGSWDFSANDDIGDGGGNSNITFSDGIDVYWVDTDGGSFSQTSGTWAHESGGTADARLPLPQDTIYIDELSIASGGKTITNDLGWTGDIDFTDVTNTPQYTWNATSDAVGMHSVGSLTLVSGMTFTQSATTKWIGRASETITSGGKTFGQGNQFLGDSMTFLDDTIISGTVRHQYGTLDFNDQDITVQTFAYSSIPVANTPELYLGNGLFTITGAGASAFSAYGNVTVESSTIKFTNSTTSATTFAGGNRTYNNLWISGSGNYATTISGSNTFNDLKIDTAPKTLKITNSSVQTVTSLTCNGAGNTITLTNTSSTTAGVISDSTGTNTCTSTNVTYNTAQGGATFETTGTVGAGATGWTQLGGSGGVMVGVPM